MQTRSSWRLMAALAVVLSTAASASVASAATVHFESPSGNINCYMFSTPTSDADCIVLQATWPNPPKKPSSCQLDWAPYEVQLSGQKVILGGCRGDIGPRCYSGVGHCRVLAYGQSVTIGSVRCSSASTGVTCRRTAGSRHPGFRIARQNVVVYR